MEILNEIAESLQFGDDERVHELTARALAQKLPPRAILDRGLLAGMSVVGEQFRRHEIFLPDVLMAAKAMYAGLDQLKPLLAGEDIPSQGKVILGTTKGDLHDIGKNLVGIMLKGAGFDVIDLGKDVPAQKFVEAAVNEQADVVGISALLTTTMGAMKEVIDLIRENNVRVKVIVGGAPVTADFARVIGADAYAYDAATAVEKIKSLLEIS